MPPKFGRGGGIDGLGSGPPLPEPVFGAGAQTTSVSRRWAKALPAEMRRARENFLAQQRRQMDQTEHESEDIYQLSLAEFQQDSRRSDALTRYVLHGLPLREEIPAGDKVLDEPGFLEDDTVRPLTPAATAKNDRVAEAVRLFPMSSPAVRDTLAERLESHLITSSALEDIHDRVSKALSKYERDSYVDGVMSHLDASKAETEGQEDDGEEEEDDISVPVGRRRFDMGPVDAVMEDEVVIGRSRDFVERLMERHKENQARNTEALSQLSQWMADPSLLEPVHGGDGEVTMDDLRLIKDSHVDEAVGGISQQAAAARERIADLHRNLEGMLMSALTQAVAEKSHLREQLDLSGVAVGDEYAKSPGSHHSGSIGGTPSTSLLPRPSTRDIWTAGTTGSNSTLPSTPGGAQHIVRQGGYRNANQALEAIAAELERVGRQLRDSESRNTFLMKNLEKKDSELQASKNRESAAVQRVRDEMDTKAGMMAERETKLLEELAMLRANGGGDDDFDPLNRIMAELSQTQEQQQRTEEELKKRVEADAARKAAAGEKGENALAEVADGLELRRAQEDLAAARGHFEDELRDMEAEAERRIARATDEAEARHRDELQLLEAKHSVEIDALETAKAQAVKDAVAMARSALLGAGHSAGGSSGADALEAKEEEMLALKRDHSAAVRRLKAEAVEREREIEHKWKERLEAATVEAKTRLSEKVDKLQHEHDLEVSAVRRKMQKVKKKALKIKRKAGAVGSAEDLALEAARRVDMLGEGAHEMDEDDEDEEEDEEDEDGDDVDEAGNAKLGKTKGDALSAVELGRKLAGSGPNTPTLGRSRAPSIASSDSDADDDDAALGRDEMVAGESSLARQASVTNLRDVSRMAMEVAKRTAEAEAAEEQAAMAQYKLAELAKEMDGLRGDMARVNEQCSAMQEENARLMDEVSVKSSALVDMMRRVRASGGLGHSASTPAVDSSGHLLPGGNGGDADTLEHSPSTPAISSMLGKWSRLETADVMTAQKIRGKIAEMEAQLRDEFTQEIRQREIAHEERIVEEVARARAETLATADNVDAALRDLEVERSQLAVENASLRRKVREAEVELVEMNRSMANFELDRMEDEGRLAEMEVRVRDEVEELRQMQDLKLDDLAMAITQGDMDYARTLLLEDATGQRQRLLRNNGEDENAFKITAGGLARLEDRRRSFKLHAELFRLQEDVRKLTSDSTGDTDPLVVEASAITSETSVRDMVDVDVALLHLLRDMVQRYVTTRTTDEVLDERKEAAQSAAAGTSGAVALSAGASERATRDVLELEQLLARQAEEMARILEENPEADDRLHAPATTAAIRRKVLHLLDDIDDSSATVADVQREVLANHKRIEALKELMQSQETEIRETEFRITAEGATHVKSRRGGLKVELPNANDDDLPSVPLMSGPPSPAMSDSATHVTPPLSIARTPSISLQSSTSNTPSISLQSTMRVPRRAAQLHSGRLGAGAYSSLLKVQAPLSPSMSIRSISPRTRDVQSGGKDSTNNTTNGIASPVQSSSSRTSPAAGQSMSRAGMQHHLMPDKANVELLSAAAQRLQSLQTGAGQTMRTAGKKDLEDNEIEAIYTIETIRAEVRALQDELMRNHQTVVQRNHDVRGTIPEVDSEALKCIVIYSCFLETQPPTMQFLVPAPVLVSREGTMARLRGTVTGCDEAEADDRDASADDIKAYLKLCTTHIGDELGTLRAELSRLGEHLGVTAREAAVVQRALAEARAFASVLETEVRIEGASAVGLAMRATLEVTNAYVRVLMQAAEFFASQDADGAHLKRKVIHAIHKLGAMRAHMLKKGARNPEKARSRVHEAVALLDKVATLHSKLDELVAAVRQALEHLDFQRKGHITSTRSLIDVLSPRINGTEDPQARLERELNSAVASTRESSATASPSESPAMMQSPLPSRRALGGNSPMVQRQMSVRGSTMSMAQSTDSVEDRLMRENAELRRALKRLAHASAGGSMEAELRALVDRDTAVREEVARAAFNEHQAREAIVDLERQLAQLGPKDKMGLALRRMHARHTESKLRWERKKVGLRTERMRLMEKTLAALQTFTSSEVEAGRAAQIAFLNRDVAARMKDANQPWRPAGKQTLLTPRETLGPLVDVPEAEAEPEPESTPTRRVQSAKMPASRQRKSPAASKVGRVSALGLSSPGSPAATSPGEPPAGKPPLGTPSRAVRMQTENSFALVGSGARLPPVRLAK